MDLKLLIIIIQINSILSNFNVSDSTTKIKNLLIKYKNTRSRRNINDLGVFVEKTVQVLNRTERYRDFLTNLAISECSRSSNKKYVKRHILDGLLIHAVPDVHWHEFKSVYDKNYATFNHEMEALASWQKNLKLVVQHNKQYLDGQHSYSIHLNHLSDLNPLKYFKKLLKHKFTLPLFDPAQDHFRTAYHKNRHKSIPKYVDWRSQGFTPHLEEQLKCGACYAFAVAHAVQAQLFKKHGDWKELSPQQIVDCSGGDGNKGCGGGSLPAAMRYAARHGLISEDHYPYTGQKDRCHFNPLLVAARPRRWATLPPDDAAVEKAVATIGPLAVAVNAAPFTFQLYRSGVYDDLFCTPWPLNHAMLLVGYTPEYWILLNWWGKNWGEDGYIRIRRSFNRCGVSSMAAYVEL